MKYTFLILTVLMFLAIVVPFMTGTQCNGSYNLDSSRPFSSNQIRITKSNNIDLCGAGHTGLYEACGDYDECTDSFISAHSFPFWKLLFMVVFGISFVASGADKTKENTP